MKDNWKEACIRQHDRDFFYRELDSFVPDRVYDAHLHLWNPDHFIVSQPTVPKTLGYEEYIDCLDILHPGRTLSALFVPWPYPAKDGPSDNKNHCRRANEWVGKQVAKDPKCRGLFSNKPGDDPEWLRQEVKRLGLHGLKCYHTWASVPTTWEADIPDYLPEEHVRVAHQEGWVILLHMVKTRAVADPSNIHWIRYYCEKYPGMKLILAHSARGHQPSHNFEGLPKLRGLNNLYFEASSICEPTAHQMVLRLFGHERFLYGTDFTGESGRSVGVSDSFLWLFDNSPVWKEKHTTIEPVLVCLEVLRALKWACWAEHVKEGEIEDIFWNNAVDLLEIG